MNVASQAAVSAIVSIGMFLAILTAGQKNTLEISGKINRTAERYLELMRIDKKSEGGEIRFVLLDGPGRAQVRAAPDALVCSVIDACCA